MFASNQKLEFTDITSDYNSMGSRARWGGCYVRTTTGFVLALLAIIIAIGVGIIVHFAGAGTQRHVQCQCNFSNAPPGKPGTHVRSSDAPGATSGIVPRGGGEVVVTTPWTPKLEWEKCETLARDKNQTMCDFCSQTTTVPPVFESIDSTLQNDLRLPTTIIPIMYDVELKPYIYGTDPEMFTFDGYVRIRILCLSHCTNITLHSLKLDIDEASAKLIHIGRAKIPTIQKIIQDERRQFLVFHLSQPLTDGFQYFLQVNFTGKLEDDLNGFYLSSYKRGNKTTYLATTQFQPTHARQAFPCFDEPAMKAQFRVILVRKEHMKSLSNMPKIREDKREDGFIADIYNTSAKMSTYLLAFVVCDFGYVENKTKSGVKVRVWTRPDALGQAHFALDVGTKILEYFEEYFDIPYPLPKQDMIAVPDFDAGAMENWGLITYREALLLCDPEATSEAQKGSVSSIISHEMAHQWFGNLVTPKWWDDLWLNEGFASYVEYMGIEFLFPERKPFQISILDSLNSALSFDGLASSHPIYQPVSDPDQIREIFDSISYLKGVSLIRMMRFFLGDETFRDGIRNYLKKLAYGESTDDDLWQALAEQSKSDGRDLDVKMIMDTWVLQMNYPVVMVKRTGENQLTVTQERFVIDTDSSKKFNSTFGYKWQIPFVYTTSKEGEFDKKAKDVIWIDYTADKTTIADQSLPSLTDENGWYVGNCLKYGHYRVNYDEKNWYALIKQLNMDYKAIDVINRGQIIDDAWSLVKADELEVEIALGTLEFLNEDDSLGPWRAAAAEMSYLKTRLIRTDTYKDLELFLRRLVVGHYHRLGWDNTGADYTESSMRTLIIEVACENNVRGCQEEVQRQFRQWMDNPTNNPINPNLKTIVYCNAIRLGGAEEWDFAYEMYKKTNVASERMLLLRSLTCSREPWILSRLLARTLDLKEIRKQDVVTTIILVSNKPIGRLLAWEFLQTNWEVIKGNLGVGMNSISNILCALAETFNTEYELEQLENFIRITGLQQESANRQIRQALEFTRTSIRWMNKNYEKVKNWLRNRMSSVERRVTDVRLPRSLVPKLYHLELTPDIYSEEPANFTFRGHVKIDMLCLNGTNNITLHVHKLEILNPIKVADITSGKEITVNSFQENREKQFLIVNLQNSLEAGHQYYIHIHFKGPLLPDLKGLYLSSYERNNETVYLATSQFQPTFARKAFPCFDEPALKARFNVVLLRMSNMTSLSNQPIIRTEKRPNGYLADYFDITPEMSTYLLAFAVCDFVNKSVQNGNFTFSVWSRKEAIEQTEYALEAGVKIMQSLENYFGIPFPLPKQDMIAVPDFQAAAMENWGLVMYQESYMLYEEGVSPFDHKRSVAGIVCHEIAHQWFGNLVTPRWWDDLWLNEGFATFIEYFHLNRVYPELNVEELFFEIVKRAQNGDSTINSHPIYQPVAHPNEIIDIFDAISYKKAASVIRMMEFFLGEEILKIGLTDYLNKLSYGTADHDDLWDALSKAWGGRDVKKIMDTWTLQMNYPLLNVTWSGTRINVTQQRYLTDESEVDQEKQISPFGYKWEIPFTFTTSDEVNFNKTNKDIFWIHKNQSSASFTSFVLPTNHATNSWVIANIQHIGFFRVTYDYKNWIAIIEQLKKDHTVIPISNRIQIFVDAWTLAKSGHLDQIIALRTLEYLHKERDYSVWSEAYMEMSQVINMLMRTAKFGKLQSFLRHLVLNLYKEFGWNTTTSNDNGSFLRRFVIRVACEKELKECEDIAMIHFNKWVRDGDPGVDADLKNVVYCVGIRKGGEEEWEFAYRKYKESNVASEKSLLLEALTCTQKPWLLSKFLDLTLDPNEIRQQDARIVIMSISNNAVGYRLAWDFIRSRWDELSTKTSDRQFMSSLLMGVTLHFNQEFELEQVKYWRSQDKEASKYERVYHSCISNIKNNIKWMKENYQIVADWLDRQNV